MPNKAAIGDFNELINYIIENTDYASQRVVVEKEVLHYDILNALDDAGLLKDLVFQGGTSLRLCRESNRLSEDLDFAGGVSFSAAKLEEIKGCIESALSVRYGLKVTVKQPKELSLEPDYENIRVSKWQISVETSPGSKNTPRQKIKIEIANVPAHTEELLPIKNNYPVLGLGRMPVLVRVETINEILADKIIAFPMSTKRVRHRDLWDIPWLIQQGATIDFDLVKQKIKDYKIQDLYPSLLDEAISKVYLYIASKDFHEQMSRFVSPSIVNQTLEKAGFKEYLSKTNRDVLLRVNSALFPENSDDHTKVNEFKM